MIAPVPYSASTKFATQIGTCLPVNGLIAVRPVSKPSFSIAPVRRASRSSARNAATLPRNAAGSALSAANRSTSGCSGASSTKVAP